MQKIILLQVLIFLLISCRGSLERNPSSSVNVSDSISNDSWYDPLILDYINRTDNELIKCARKDTIQVEWLLDRIETTDSAKYLIFHIGHDVEDSVGVNRRFATDGWVYIDSLTKKIYEYDIPNDSLIEWKNNATTIK